MKRTNFINKKISKQSGITLIALVLTIIILLILAGVTIATLTGDNGLLQKATTAKQENEDAKELELIKLAVAAAQVTGNGTITTENLNNELRDNFSDNGIKTDEIQDGWSFKSYKIDKNGKVEKLLPKEYKQVEYIESSGTQYIDTLFLPDSNSGVETKIKFLNTLAEQMSGSGWYNEQRFDFGVGDSGRSFAIAYGNWYEVKNSDLDIHIFKIDSLKKIVSVDNTEINITTSYHRESDLTVYLFVRNRSGALDKISTMRLYWCKLLDNGNINRNFIPCKSTTNVLNAEGNPVPADTKGLYDLVEGKFYTNKNTDGDDFTAGPEV